TIDDVLDLRGIDLKVHASGTDLAALGLDKSIRLPKTSAFDVTGHLRGSKETLALNKGSGNLSASGINLDFRGNVGDLIPLSGIDLQLNGSGQDLSAVGSIIGEKLPSTDKFTVQGHLMGSTTILSLKEAQGSAKRGSLSVDINGEVTDLIAFSGVDLQIKGSGKNLAEIGSMIGEKLPATDEFKVQGRLTGSAKALSLQTAQGNARRGNLKLSLQGGIKDLIRLSGMDLKLDGSGKDLSEVGPIIGEKLPATGAFTVQGRLTGSTKALALEKSQVRVRRGDLSLSLDGSIKNLTALTGIDIRFKGSGMNLAEVGPIIEKKLPTTDNFAVQGRLNGSMKALSLREAMGRASRAGMSVAFDGEITDVLALSGINIRLKASGKELAAIGPLVGSDLPKIGPFDVRGHLAGSAKLLMAKEFSAIVDKSDFKGLVKVAFLKRPKITVRLESSVIDFTALMKSLEKDEQKSANKDKQKSRLFSDDPLPFDVLKKVDADIVMKTKNIHVKDARLKFGHMALKLEDSDFSIDKLEATYKRTKISGNLQINAGTPSQVATRFLVQNLNLGDFLKETGKSDQIQAIVDIAAHGKSKGDSVHSLMANLDGSIGAVMGEGYLTKYLDMLSVGLSQKVVHFWKPPKTVDQIKCAVVQFDIKEGVAASQAFVFNTRAGILTGEGKIHLGTEQVNFLLVPKPAHPSLSLTTKLRVSGTVMEPTVLPDAISLLTKGAEALSTLVVGPLALLAPFVHLGALNAHPCNIESIGQLGLQSPASK
ncbi:MAG: AsmA-like C-terminal region-containing protein, partial [Desulfobacterales bacterium]